MDQCDQCEGRPARFAVAGPRPSDPSEIVSIMYVCGHCAGIVFTNVKSIAKALKASPTAKIAAKPKMWQQYIESHYAAENGHLWLSI